MVPLFERFVEFLKVRCSISLPHKIVLAVSGGIDSVVMMHLFHQAGFDCEVAHCNFQLRDAASDADEEFVKQLSQHYGFRFHVKRFLTAQFANDNAISIQMAARQLRYEWFQELIDQHNFSAVSVAHHANDAAETMLLNLTKGTGIAGMHGILPVHGKVIRPLLFSTKNELKDYATEHKLNWREDASNSEVYYQRNKIRKEVIPLLEQVNPDFTGAMMRHARLMSGYEALISDYVTQMESSMVKETLHGGIKSILLKPLLASPAPAILLYHFLKPYGASGALCEEIVSGNHTGAEFYSRGVKIVRDREALTIFNFVESSDQEFLLQPNDRQLNLPFGKLEITEVVMEPDGSLMSLPGFVDANVAYVNAEALKFPLTIRKWRNGDVFQPLGMRGRKLLSDYFIDSKFSSASKEVVYLLVSEGEVVWVIGHRLDERFKIGNSTSVALRFNYFPY